MHGTRKRKPNNEATGNLSCSEDLADDEDFLNDPKTGKARGGKQNKLPNIQVRVTVLIVVSKLHYEDAERVK